MSKKNHGACLVCADISVGINFGVPTCMPCKAFFRRNAFKLGADEFQCRKNGDCIIAYNHRRSCNYCRLQKCYLVGMKKSLILSDETREARNALVTINRLKRGQIPKLSSVSWMQPPILFRMYAYPNSNISSSDQITLANVFQAYENTCIVARNTRFQSFPQVPHTSIHGLVNEIGPLFEIFIEYFKFVPQFNTLALDDRVRIMKNHFGTMININQPLMYSVMPTNLLITWTNVFNLDITERLLKRNQIVNEFMFDPMIIRILLIIVVLSSGNCRNIDNTDMDLICDDSLSIFAAQNVYVELLWRYMLSRSGNVKTTIRLFNRLLMFILFVQNFDMRIDDYVRKLGEEIKQMEPIMQNMWPKPDESEQSTNIDLV